MPRLKRALAEADYNASLLASNPKSAKTGTGKDVKNAASEHGLKDREEKAAVSRRCNPPRTEPTKAPIRPARNPNPLQARQQGHRSAQSPTTKHVPHIPLQSLSISQASSNGVGSDGVGLTQERRDGNIDGPVSGAGSKLSYTNTDKEDIGYKTKDNSKLRVFLLDRNLPTSGTREEMIARLETSSINYETLSADEVTKILKRRHVACASQGAKAMRIERLRLNDKLDRDTGNGSESVLYGRISAIEMMLKERVAEQEKVLTGCDNRYFSKKVGQLSHFLEKRGLTSSGSKEAMIAQLQGNDCETLAKDIGKFTKDYDSLKQQIESRTGHPLMAYEVLEDKESELKTADYRIQNEVQRSRSRIPICDYNWRDSHWASRTGRQLTEICLRREMPGYGPKAAMIKWLETGSVRYEDLYAGSLETICSKRGIKYQSGDKKVNLVRLLKEFDEVEGSG